MNKLLFLAVAASLVAAAVGHAADPDDKVVLDLITQFKDPKAAPEVRTTAIRSLGLLGWPGRSGVPDLIKLIDDPQERKAARDTLGPYLQAIVALGRIGSSAREAVPSLVKAKGVAAVYDQAIDAALESILVPSGGSTAALLASLKDYDPAVKVMAARALGGAGGEAALVLPALRDAAKDADPEVARAAQEALRQVTQQEVIRLALLLRDRDDNVRLLAAKSLRTYGADAAAALPLLAEATRDPDPDVARVALETGRKITQQEIERLIGLLKDKDANVRLLAARALGRMGQSAEGAVDALTESATKDADADVKAIAASALRKIRGEKKP